MLTFWVRLEKWQKNQLVEEIHFYSFRWKIPLKFWNELLQTYFSHQPWMILKWLILVFNGLPRKKILTLNIVKKMENKRFFTLLSRFNVIGVEDTRKTIWPSLRWIQSRSLLCSTSKPVKCIFRELFAKNRFLWLLTFNNSAAATNFFLNS